MTPRHLLACAIAWAAACSSISAPANESPALDAAVPDAELDIPDTVVDRNCTDVKARLAIGSDGVHAIDPDLDGPNPAFDVFCADMATAAPKEYLELARRALPADPAPASNFTTFASGTPHGQWTCDCGVATGLFAKVRIDPATLRVDATDRRFTVLADSTRKDCIRATAGCPPLEQFVQVFGAAASCVDVAGGLHADGRANVDLRDLPFHVAPSATFAGFGFAPSGTVTFDATRKVASMTGGGDCGGFGTSGALPLAFD
jgi:hypothetical protein